MISYNRLNQPPCLDVPHERPDLAHEPLSRLHKCRGLNLSDRPAGRALLAESHGEEPRTDEEDVAERDVDLGREPSGRGLVDAL